MMAAVIRLAVRESMYTNMPTVYKSLLRAQQLKYSGTTYSCQLFVDARPVLPLKIANRVCLSLD